MKRTARITSALLLAALLGSTSACVVTARGRVRTGAVVVYEEPPAAREEIEYSQGRSGYVWVRGRYDWQGGQWVWAPGHWERERSGYMWNDGRWERRDNSWHWVEGQWVVHGSGTVVTNGGGGRPQEIDHRGGGGGGGGGSPPPVVGHAGNPDGSGVGVVSGNGQVVVNVHGPTSAPPPVRVENPGPSRGGYVWVRGYYEWRQNQYVWIPGHWERERMGHQWFDGRWELQGNVYVWVQGEWRAGGAPQGGSVRDRRTH
ncbi:MAG TPA: YXWGXW repeat-containing protein [Kofleriaceae bacterium]|nr:YXWGXW repeat-containing protein [Kofleriaceae bacterium]